MGSDLNRDVWNVSVTGSTKKHYNMDRQNFLPAFDAQGVGQITPMVQMNIFGKNVK